MRTAVLLFLFTLNAAALAAAPVVAKGSRIVMSYDDGSRAAANQILDQGGNAFDAYVAATFVDYVDWPGVTSPSGPISAMIYSPKVGAVQYLDGDYNAARKNDRISPGGAFLVPGAVRALELLSKTRGQLTFAQVLQPAITRASKCFALTPLYATSIRLRQEILKKSEYGRKTFFRADGTPLTAGETLCLPEFAQFLKNLAQFGADYMYTGTWAKSAITLVNASGGAMQAADLANYRAFLRPPRSTTFNGYEIFGSPGRNYGGLHTLIGLNVLKFADLDLHQHYSQNATDLAKMVRISRYMYRLVGGATFQQLDNEAYVQRLLSDASAKEIWRQIQTLGHEPEAAVPHASHSHHLIVADEQGNVVSGTSTITSMPWASGLFVEGVPLNDSAKVMSGFLPGERLVDSRAAHIVFKNNKFFAACGAFNMSLMPANFQFLTNLLLYNKSESDSVTLPRFGGYPIDLATGTVDIYKNELDPRYPPEMVKSLNEKGLFFKQDGYIETGDGGIVIQNADGTYSGAYSPPSFAH